MRALGLAAIALLAGCVGERLLAPLPDDPAVPVAALSSQCGMKPTRDFWIVFPAKDLVHAEIRFTDDNGQTMRANEPLDAATTRAVDAAERVKLWSRADGPAHRGTHGETVSLTPGPFTDVRAAVAEADFETLDASYFNEGIADGCEWRYAGFAGGDADDLRVVSDYADAGPEKLRALRAVLLSLHARY